MKDSTPGLAAPILPPEKLPERVDFEIEVPRGGFVKRGPDGKVDFVSPVPCPFNYGSAIGYWSADGDPTDVIVLGPRLGRGHRGNLAVFARVRMRDRGHDDPKWICATERPDEDAIRVIDRFFSVYALLKLAWHRRRGEHVETRYAGIDLVDAGRVVRALSGGTARARFRPPRGL